MNYSQYFNGIKSKLDTADELVVVDKPDTAQAAFRR